MIRTQVYLTEILQKGLERMSVLTGMNRSNLIRLAISNLLEKTEHSMIVKRIEDVAGIWKDSVDIPDIREFRSNWRNRIRN